MNVQEYRQLQAERATLENLLKQLPASSVIERKGLEFRKKEVEETLASQPAPSRQPAQVRLTFRGRPILGTHGIFADFGAEAIKAFTDAVAAIGASQRTPLKARGKLPDREDYQLLITDTALGSFGFELEEAPRDNAFSEAPHADVFREVSPVESAIKQTMSILEATLGEATLGEATLGTDEMLTDAVSDADPRALKFLCTFLKKLADQDAVCALEFKDDVFHFSDVSQVRRSERRLSREHVHEEEQEISGQLQGVLPTRRTFEFLNEATGEVISGKVASAIADVDAITKVLNRPATIRVRSRRVGAARRRYVLLAYEDISGQGED